MESNKNVIYSGLGLLGGAILIFWIVPASILRPLLYLFLFLGSIFLILLVLIQRGRGGGLAGALGGMGGYSAFGTRAGDIFTRITIISASLWILSAMALAKLNTTGSHLYDNAAPPTTKTTIPGQLPELTGPSSSEVEVPAKGSGETPADTGTGTKDASGDKSSDQ